MHFPLFQISPLFSENFQTLSKIFKIVPFPEKFLDFHLPKFLMNFLVIDHKFRISPYFPCFSTFPLYRENYYFPPTFKNVPPVLKNSPAFYMLYVYFVSHPTLTMMHSCITQCTHWTPLIALHKQGRPFRNLGLTFFPPLFMIHHLKCLCSSCKYKTRVRYRDLCTNQHLSRHVS